MGSNLINHDLADENIGYQGIFTINQPLDGDRQHILVEQERFISIHIGNRDYLLNIQLIREIVLIPKITFVPHGPKFIEGVINLRGTILPVINLRKMLGETPRKQDSNARILICEDQELQLKTGVLVDAISVVVNIDKKDIDLSSSTMATSGYDLLTGLSKQGQKVFGVLNLNKIILTASDGRALDGGSSDASARHEDES